MSDTSAEVSNQSAGQRRRWAAMTAERRAEIAAKISKAKLGKPHSEAHCLAMSEGRKGKVASEASKARVSESLKRAYAEGRKQPVRSSHRKGAVLTEEQKTQISNTLKAQHLTPWNKGTEMGPRPDEVKERIAATLKGKLHPISPDKVAAWKANISASKKGSVQSAESNAKRSASLVRAYAEGRKVVSDKSGYGQRFPYQSPFQGTVTLRSSSELERARELDAAGVAWFYEVKRFSVIRGDKTSTYTPDFWVVPRVTRDEVPTDFATFLDTLDPSSVEIEDVKGWWGPGHKTYPKIQAFQAQYPHLNFRIVQRNGLGSSPQC